MAKMVIYFVRKLACMNNYTARLLPCICSIFAYNKYHNMTQSTLYVQKNQLGRVLMKRGIIILFATLPLLAACNTIQGLGQDIKDGGRFMDKTINGDRSSDRDFQN